MKDRYGALLMAAVGIVPTAISAGITLILALTVGHPWNWISGGFGFTALFFTFAAVVIYREDNPT